MRRRLLGQIMAASTSSILIWGSVWGVPSIIEISVIKFKIRLISEVLVNSVWACDNTNLLFLNINLKKRALQIGLPQDKNRNWRTSENTSGVGLHLTLPAPRINYYNQVEACVWTNCLESPEMADRRQSGLANVTKGNSPNQICFQRSLYSENPTYTKIANATWAWLVEAIGSGVRIRSPRHGRPLYGEWGIPPVCT
jgi:hypothetical protein